jgi:hypothetical protein
MKKLGLTHLIFGLLLSSVSHLQAAAQLRLSDGTTTVVITDGDAQDSASASGVISYVGAVGPNWNVAATGSTKPSFGSAAAPLLDVSLTASSQGAGYLTVELTDEGFTTASTITPNVIGRMFGTSGSVTEVIWSDSGNGAFGETTQVASVGPLTPDGTGKVSGSGNGGFTGAVTPYSLTEGVILTNNAAGGASIDAAAPSTSTSSPSLQLIKTASPANAAVGQPVTYSYAVTNTGNVEIDNINIVDDNGTPGDTSDDYYVNAAPFNLAAGQGTAFAVSHISEPTCMQVSGSNVFTGTLTVNVLPTGDVEVIFNQSQNNNDNRYGTGATAATGWKNGHKFSDLTGSDEATFLFTDGNGKSVLEFQADYITAATSTKFGDGVPITYPSGYGTLGPLGGDGKMLIGSSSNVLSVHTTLSDTLNQSPTFYGFIVNSPPETSPNSSISTPPGWNYTDGYDVIVSKNAFGAAGFGGVTIPLVHNSPPKIIDHVVVSNACSCVVNTATAFAVQGTTIIASSTDTAQVCFGPPTPCIVLGSCTPPYPFPSANPLTSIAFNESGVLRTSIVAVATGTAVCTPDHIELFYNDEHAMALGIRQVIVKNKAPVGNVTNNYSLSQLLTDPEAINNPAVGSTITTGDQAGVDASGRPLFPALFITDLTTNPNPLGGDWQYGGTAIPPTAVYGSWKGFVKTVDKTVPTPTVTLTADPDPLKNNWSLAAGSDPVPPGLANEGYGTEVRWDVSKLGLISGHTYRLYFMVHDGDQNKVGGDSGQACATITAP